MGVLKKNKKFALMIIVVVVIITIKVLSRVKIILIF